MWHLLYFELDKTNYASAIYAPDIIMIIAGLLGAIGIPLECIGYIEVFKSVSEDRKWMKDLYLFIMFAKGKAAYPRKAVWYNMIFGVIASIAASMVIGNNVAGNAIGTGCISFGHLWMFGGLLTSEKEEMT